MVTANYYSLGGPTLAHRLVDHYELRSDTDKYHVVGVGCASAVPLLRLAAQALRDRPGEHALVVAAESVSGFLCPVAPGDEKVKVVGSALFGDGAAAALVSLEPDATGPASSRPRFTSCRTPSTPSASPWETRAATWRSRASCPRSPRRRSPSSCMTSSRGTNCGIAAIDHWPVHPGGRGILDALRAGLGLSAEDVGPSAAVLADHGNVGTPSAFFVLERTIAERRPQPGRPRSGGHHRAGRHRGPDASAMASQSIEEMVS